MVLLIPSYAGIDKDSDFRLEIKVFYSRDHLSYHKMLRDAFMSAFSVCLQFKQLKSLCDFLLFLLIWPHLLHLWLLYAGFISLINLFFWICLYLIFCIKEFHETSEINLFNLWDLLSFIDLISRCSIEIRSYWLVNWLLNLWKKSSFLFLIFLYNLFDFFCNLAVFLEKFFLEYLLESCVCSFLNWDEYLLFEKSFK